MRDLDGTRFIEGDKLIWEAANGDDLIEVWGESIPAGYQLIDSDHFLTNTTGNWTKIDGSAVGNPSWSNTGPASNDDDAYAFRMGGAGQTVWQPSWSTQSGDFIVDARVRSSEDQDMSFKQVGLALVSAAGAALATFYLQSNNWNLYIGANQRKVSPAASGLGNTGVYWWVLRLKREGNRITVAVYNDMADPNEDAPLWSDFYDLAGGEIASVGTGVAVRPSFLANSNGSYMRLGWMDVQAVLAEQRNIMLAVTPSGGGARTVKRLFGSLGATTLRSDFDALPVGNVGAPKVKTANYVAAAGDVGKVLEMNAASLLQLTIPPGVFAVGDTFEVHRYGSGIVQLVPGAGVTLNSKDNLRGIAKQFGSVRARCRANNEFELTGDCGSVTGLGNYGDLIVAHPGAIDYFPFGDASGSFQDFIGTEDASTITGTINRQQPGIPGNVEGGISSTWGAGNWFYQGPNNNHLLAGTASPWSVELWVFLTSLPGNDDLIGTNGNNGDQWRLQAVGDGTNPGFKFAMTGFNNQDGISFGQAPSSSVALNVWHHIVVTYGGTADPNMRFYLDGAFRGSPVPQTAPRADQRGAGVPLRINNLGTMKSGWRLDEMAFYNVQLSLSEIVSHYNRGMGF